MNTYSRKLTKSGEQIAIRIMNVKAWGKEIDGVFYAMHDQEMIDTSTNKKGFSSIEKAIEYAEKLKNQAIEKII